MTRGYTDDALFYIREAKKQYGNTDKGILYKEYMLYRQMNEDNLAYSALKKLYDMYPDDYDIALAMSSLHMKKPKDYGTRPVFGGIASCIIRFTKAYRQRSKRCRMGKSTELLYQYEALQRSARHIGYHHTSFPRLRKRHV